MYRIQRFKAVVVGIDSLLVAPSLPHFLRASGISPYHHSQFYPALQNYQVDWPTIKAEFFEPVITAQTPVSHLVSSPTHQLTGAAINTVKHLKQLGYIIGLVSASIDYSVQLIANQLGVMSWYANTRLTSNEQGALTDITYYPQEALLKLFQVEQFLTHHHLQPSECLVVAGGKSDLQLTSALPSVVLSNNSAGPEHACGLASVNCIERLPQWLGTQTI